MFLTSSNLVHYLVSRGLLSSKNVVDGTFSVAEAGRHNRNFKVVFGHSNGVFVKQIPAVEDLTKEAIRKEALSYKLACDFPQWNKWMLEMRDYDPTRHCLCLELDIRCQNLREFYYQHDAFPLRISHLVGGALADLHSVPVDRITVDSNLLKTSESLPWIFTYHDKPRFKQGALSGGAIALGKYVRENKELVFQLAQAAARWRPHSLMHGDVKWDNFLLSHQLHAFQTGSDAETYQLKLIDWEMLDIGDPAWDVGAVFQAYLSHWIMRRYRDKSQGKEYLLEDTYEKLPSIFSSINCFWEAYNENSELDFSEQHLFLLKCVEYGAIRLLQTAFESLFESTDLTSHALAMLDLSEQMLCEPERAKRELLGIAT